ncbi:hypothetical protein DRO42_02500 [Candidatus Bathyarchaeota archaeon]|nr:MAG: hypothetical protein DRO42_02500 [Candidatus Bathyarchaeota archaeon]
MNRDRVAVVEVERDVGAAVNRAVELIGGLRLKGGERVVIKPNVCNSKNPYGMVLTDFRVVEAVIDMVRVKTSRVLVVESDNISGSAEKRMSESGLLGKLRKWGVEFLNLSGDEAEAHEVAGVEIRLPRTVLDADCFINLPKIKTCGHTLVTLSIKNLFGILQRARKNKLHRHLDEVLPYLAKVVRHSLIVVDGITAMEGNGPVIGTPKDLGVIVAGVNPVAVDAICTGLMGFDPAEVKHLARAHEMGLGEISLDAIEAVEDDWRRLSQVFERPYSLKASLKSLRSIGKVYLSPR